MRLRERAAAFAATGLLCAGVVLAAPAAEAHAAVDTLACARVSNNAAGACIYYLGSDSYKVTLWDNKCDHHGAYAEYSFEILGRHRFGPETKCGKNYSTWFVDNHAYHRGQIRVCIDKFGPDTCSKWSDWERWN